MVILKSRRWSREKPPPGWRPDWTNPILRGCVWSMPLNEGGGQPLVHQPGIGPFAIATQADSTPPQWITTPTGPALYWNGTGFHALEIEAFRSSIIDLGTEFTWHWVGRLDVTVGTPLLFGRPAYSNYWTAISNWSGAQTLYIQYGGSTFYAEAGLANKLAPFSLTITGDGTTMRVYTQGRLVGSDANGTNSGTAVPFYIGYGPVYGNFIGALSSLTSWRRALSAAEVQALSIEPYALYSVPQRRMYILPWVPSAKVGAINATLGAIVGAGSARVGQTGGIGATLGAITGASIARFGPRGSVSAVLGAITGAIAGAFRSQGTISAGLGPVIGAAAAVSTIRGSGAIAAALGPVVCSASGVASAVVAGAINVPLGPIESAMAATVRADGSITGGLGPIVGAATGLSAANVAGDVAGQLGPITSLASGVVGVRAAIAGQLGPVQCEAVAGVQGTAIGYVAAVIGPITGGGQINIGGYAAIAGQLGAIQCVIAALAEASGGPGPISSSGAEVFRLGPRQRIVSPAPRRRVVALGPRERIARKEPRV